MERLVNKGGRQMLIRLQRAGNTSSKVMVAATGLVAAITAVGLSAQSAKADDAAKQSTQTQTSTSQTTVRAPCTKADSDGVTTKVRAPFVKVDTDKSKGTTEVHAPFVKVDNNDANGTSEVRAP